MRLTFVVRASLIALTAIVGASVSSAAYAEGGTIRISVLKGGWVIGATGGSGTLTFQGRRYPLSIGGLSAVAGRVRAIVLRNEKGAILELSGQQTGLMVNADLSGLAISLR